MACLYCGCADGKHLIGCPNDDDERPEEPDMMDAAKQIIEEQDFNWDEWHRWNK
jgi:hypothetical protein